MKIALAVALPSQGQGLRGARLPRDQAGFWTTAAELPGQLKEGHGVEGSSEGGGRSGEGGRTCSLTSPLGAVLQAPGP